MKLEKIQKTKDKLIFKINNVSSAFVNSLRRACINEVPTLAIEDVEIFKNDSALYDEIIAHRLGLIPIKTDLKSYNLKEECTCKGAGCAKCTLKFKLSSKKSGYVFASELKSQDPKCNAAIPDLPITKLIKGQALELEATAVLGRGKDHAKFSPCHAFFKAEAIINFDESKINQEIAEKIAASCPRKIFDVVNGKLKVNKEKLIECDLCLSCEKDGYVKVESSEKNFIFYLEPFGQLKAEEILEEAAKIIQDKARSFIESLKNTK